jgi:hypothetical protein
MDDSLSRSLGYVATRAHGADTWHRVLQVSRESQRSKRLERSQYECQRSGDGDGRSCGSTDRGTALGWPPTEGLRPSIGRSLSIAMNGAAVAMQQGSDCAGAGEAARIT